MVDSELTIAANALWMGVIAFSAMVAIWLVRHQTSARVAESARWALLPGACYYLHRGWWNVGMITDTSATSGPYAPWTVDYRHWLLVLLIAAAYGTWRVLRPWVADTSLTSARWWLVGLVAAHVAAWTAAYWVAQG